MGTPFNLEVLVWPIIIGSFLVLAFTLLSETGEKCPKCDKRLDYNEDYEKYYCGVCGFSR